MVDEPTHDAGDGSPFTEGNLDERTAALRSVNEALLLAEGALRRADEVLPGGSGAARFRALSPAVALAGVASLAAGAVHAAAIGAHAEHQQVVRVFTAMALAQLVWGVATLVRPTRWLSSIGVVLGGAAVVGWIMAKTSGVSFVDGMEVAEPVQWSDGLCAAFAAIAAIGAGVHLLIGAGTTFAPAGRGRADAGRVGTGRAAAGRAGRSARGAVALRRGAFVGSAAIAVLSFTGMNAAVSHSHAGGGHHGVAATGHDDATSDHHAEGETAAGAEGHGDHGTPAAVAPVPYDPAKPIDLGGVDGVSPEQQARAENLIAVTLARLPQFSDYTTLESKGFHSIRDGVTGYEHYVNWGYINDGRELDPDYPESLVFQVQGGTKQLVSAMFMAEGGVDLENVPDIGGPLTQWHIHDNLCYTLTDPPRLAGLTGSDGNCRPGTRILGEPVPMIHVWIRSHECGPFAALEGIAAGQVKKGETTMCDAAHGHTA